MISGTWVKLRANGENRVTIKFVNYRHLEGELLWKFLSGAAKAPCMLDQVPPCPFNDAMTVN